MGNCFGTNPEDDDVSLLQDIVDDRQPSQHLAHETAVVSKCCVFIYILFIFSLFT